MSDERATVGVLSLHTSKETKAILNAVEGLGHRGVWLREETLSVEIEGGEAVLTERGEELASEPEADDESED